MIAKIMLSEVIPYLIYLTKRIHMLTKEIEDTAESVDTKG